LQEVQPFELVFEQVAQVIAQLRQFPFESGKNPLLHTQLPSDSLTALILHAWQEVESPFVQVAQVLWQGVQFPFESR
jgi:hypothetical protein